MTLEDLRGLLDHLTPPLDAHAAPWVLIGSGALMLAGAPVESAADLDVVTTPECAVRLRAAWADWLSPHEAKPPDGPFRSDDFAQYETPWGSVEVMGGLRVRGKLLTIGARHATLPIPAATEQLRILRLFGRPKDLAKAALLESWLAAG